MPSRTSCFFVVYALFLFCGWVSTAQASVLVPDQQAQARLIEQGGQFTNLRTLHIAIDGDIVVARGFNGASPDAATNVKSASKTLMAAIIGAAIERGVISGVDERVIDVLPQAMPADPDPRLAEMTIGHLLSMQSGLKRTSGRNYGAWVASANWVESALGQPVEEQPGGRMRYSTGNTHLLSAILQAKTGQLSYVLGNEWLGDAGVRAEQWMEDPQGIALGGNQVAMRPTALLALGELYRRDGIAPNGERLLPEGWVQASWQPRGRSRWSGDGYGYGWFVRNFGGHTGYYGWGYGGQMLYVIPDLKMTVVMTSDPNNPSGRTGYRDALHRYLTDWVRSAKSARLAQLRNPPR